MGKQREEVLEQQPIVPEVPAQDVMKQLITTRPEYKEFQTGQFAVKEFPDGHRTAVFQKQDNIGTYTLDANNQHNPAFNKIEQLDYTNQVLIGKGDISTLIDYNTTETPGLSQIVNFPDEIGYTMLKAAYPEADIDLPAYKEKKAEIMKTYDDFKAIDAQHKLNMNPGYVVGEMIPGVFVKKANLQQVAMAQGEYTDQYGNKVKLSDKSNNKLLKMNPNDLSLQEIPWEEETDSGDILIGMDGAPEMYGGGAGGFFRGMLNLLPMTIQGMGQGIKTMGDISYYLANAIEKTTGLDVPGTEESDYTWNNEMYNRLNNVGKTLTVRSEEDESSLSYMAGQGTAQALQMYMGNMAVGKLAHKAGMSVTASANLARGAAGASMTLPVGAMFTDQMRANGIPESEIRYMSMVMMAITGLSETFLSPGILVDAYGRSQGKAQFKKILQDNYNEILKPLANQGKEIPKSAYSNFMKKTGEKFFAFAKNGRWDAPQGFFKETSKAGVIEGFEESIEGTLQNTAAVVHDVIKQHMTGDKFNYPDKPKGYFGAPTKDIADIVGYITKDELSDFVAGGLGAASGVGLIGLSSRQRFNRMFGSKAAQDRANWSIENMIIDGKIDNVKDIVLAMKKRGFGYDHLSAEDGSIRTVGDGKKSIDDLIYESINDHINQVGSLWKVAGINNPTFIKEALGGDKPLMIETLDNLVKQKALQDDIATIKQEALNNPAAKPEEATEAIKGKEQQIAELKVRMDEIKSGKAYDDKLKHALIQQYFQKPENYDKGFNLDDAQGNKGRVSQQDQEQRNQSLKPMFDAMVELETERIAAQNEIRKKSRERGKMLVGALAETTKTLKGFDEKNQNLIDEINQLNLKIHDEAINHGLNKEDYDLYHKNIDNIKGVIGQSLEEINTEMGEAGQAGTEIDPEVTALYDKLSNVGGNIETNQKKVHEQGGLPGFFNVELSPVDIQKIQNDLYYYDNTGKNWADVAKDIAGSAESMSDVNALNKEGDIYTAERNINIARQHAMINRDVYSRTNQKFTGIDPSIPNTKEYYDNIIDKSTKLLEDLQRTKDKIGFNARERTVINRARRFNTLRINNDILKNAIEVLPDKLMTEISDILTKAEGALDDYERLPQEQKDEVAKITEAEGNIKAAEKIIHQQLDKNPKLQDEIYSHLVKKYALGNQSSTIPWEFLTADFNALFNYDTWTGKNTIKAPVSEAQRKRFMGYFMSIYINNLSRKDPNVTDVTIANLLESSGDLRAPSYEHIQTLRHIDSFLANPSKNWREGLLKTVAHVNESATPIAGLMSNLIDNALTVRGYNATGKTSFVLPLVGKLARIRNEGKPVNIMHVALTEPLVNEMAYATRESGTASGYTLKNFLDLTSDKANEIMKKFDLIVFDEFSVLDSDAVNKLRELINKGGITAPVLFFGDQGQAAQANMTEDYLPIEIVTERTVPMTVSYRTSSADINNLVDAFRKVIYFNNNTTDIEPLTTFYDKDRTVGVESFRDKNKLYDTATNDFKADKPFIFIVKGETERAKAISTLVGKGIPDAAASAAVKTIVWSMNDAVSNTVQGLQFPRIYVDIDPSEFIEAGLKSKSMYYRMLLTAVSRAGGPDTKQSYVGIFDAMSKINSHKGSPAVGSVPVFDKKPVINYLRQISKVSTTETKKQVVKDKPKKTPKKKSTTNAVELVPVSKTEIDRHLKTLGSFQPDTVVINKKTGDTMFITGISQNRAADAEPNDLYIHLSRLQEPVQIDELRKNYQSDIEGRYEPSYLVDIENRFEKTAVKYEIHNQLRLNPIGFEKPDTEDTKYTESIRRQIRGLLQAESGAKVNEAKNTSVMPAVELEMKKGVKVYGTEKAFDNVVLVKVADKKMALRAAQSLIKGTTASDVEKHGLDVIGMLHHADSGFDVKAIDAIPDLKNKYSQLSNDIQNGFKDDRSEKALRKYHQKLLDTRMALESGQKIKAYLSDVTGAEVAHDFNIADDVALGYGDFLKKYVNDKSRINKLTIVHPPAQTEFTGKDGKRHIGMMMMVSYLPDGALPVPVFLESDNITKQDAADYLKESQDLVKTVEKMNPVAGRDLIENSMAYKTIIRNRAVFNGKFTDRYPAAMVPDEFRRFVKVNDKGQAEVLGYEYGKDSVKDKAENLVRLWQLIKEQPSGEMIAAFQKALRIDSKPEQIGNVQGYSYNIEPSMYNELKVLATNVAQPGVYISGITEYQQEKGTVTKDSIKFPSTKKGGMKDLTMAYDNSSVNEQWENTWMRDREGKKIISTILGESFVSSRLDFKPKDELSSEDGRLLYGLVKDGVMSLERRITPDGKRLINPGVAFHEPIHFILENILSKESSDKILNAVKAKLNLLKGVTGTEVTFNEAHEFLADEFTNSYYNKNTGEFTGKAPKNNRTSFLGKIIDNFMSWVSRTFDRITGNYDIIDDFFDKVDRGYFSDKPWHGGNSFDSPEFAMTSDETFSDTEDNSQQQDGMATFQSQEEEDNAVSKANDFQYLKKLLGSDETILQAQADVASQLWDLTLSANPMEEPRNLLEAIEEMIDYYRQRGEQILSQDERDAIDSGEITGDNFKERLSDDKYPAYRMYVLSQKDAEKDFPNIIRIVQAIYKDRNLEELMNHSEFGDADLWEQIKTYTRAKGREQFDSSADEHDWFNKMSDYLKQMFSTTKLHYFSIDPEDGSLRSKESKRYINPSLMSTILMEAGRKSNTAISQGQFRMTHLERIADNLLKAAKASLTSDNESSPIYTETGNTILSFYHKYMALPDQVTGELAADKVTMRMYRDNYEELINLFPGYRDIIDEKKKRLTDMFSAMVVFARSMKFSNFMHTKVTSTRTEDGNIYDYETVIANTSKVEELKNRMNTSVMSVIYDNYAEGDEEQSTMVVSEGIKDLFGLNPKKRGQWKVEQSGGGFTLSSISQKRPLITLKSDGSVVVPDDADKADFPELFKSLGIYGIRQDAVNMFWNAQKPGQGDIQFTKERLGEIAAAIAMTGYNVAVDNNQLNTALLHLGKSSDMEKKAVFNSQGFHRYVLNLAAAQSDVMGLDHSRHQMSLTGKKIFSYSPGETMSMNFPLQSQSEDSSHGLKMQANNYLGLAQNNVLEVDGEMKDMRWLADNNANFYINEEGNGDTYNPIYKIYNPLNKPEKDLRVQVYRILTGKDVMMEGFKAVGHGRKASSEDVMDMHLNAFIDEVIHKKKHQILRISLPQKSDSPKGEMAEISLSGINEITDGKSFKGQDMFYRHALNIFDFYKHQSEVSINKWVEFLGTIGTTLDKKIVQGFKDDPASFERYINNLTLTPEDINALLASDLQSVKDYNFKGDKLTVGRAALFSDKANKIFNYANWSALQEAQQNGASKEELTTVLDNIIAEPFKRYAYELKKKNNYQIPELFALDALKDQYGNTQFWLKNEKAAGLALASRPESGLEILSKEEIAEHRKRYPKDDSYNKDYAPGEDITDPAGVYFLPGGVGVRVKSEYGTKIAPNQTGTFEMLDNNGDVMGTFNTRRTVTISSDYMKKVGKEYMKDADIIMHPLYKAHFLANEIFGHWLNHTNNGSAEQYTGQANYTKRIKEQAGYLPDTNPRGGLPNIIHTITIHDAKELWDTNIFVPGDKSIDSTDGEAWVNPIFERLYYGAMGGPVGVSGQGVIKSGYDYYDMLTDRKLKRKDSDKKITWDVYKNSLAIRKMVKAMLSPRLHTMFEDFLKNSDYDTAWDNLTDYIRAESSQEADPEKGIIGVAVHDEYVSKFQFPSGTKTGLRRFNNISFNDFTKGDIGFDQFIKDQVDVNYLRYISNKDTDPNEAEAGGPKQLDAGFTGQIAKDINELNANKTNLVIDSIKEAINNSPGSTRGEKVQNYWKEQSKKMTVSEIANAGVFNRLMSDPNIDTNIGLLESRIIQAFVQKVNREGIKPQVPAQRVVQGSGIYFSFFDGNDGNVYPLHKVESMSAKEVAELGIDINSPRPPHPVRWVNAETNQDVTNIEEWNSLVNSNKAKVIPGEAAVSYPYIDKFKIGKDETPLDVMSIKFKDGTTLRLNKVTNDAEQIEGVLKSEYQKRHGKKKGQSYEDIIDIENSPSFRMMGSIDGAAKYIVLFRKTLDMVLARIPHGDMSFATVITPTVFVNDQQSIGFFSSKKNLKDGTDNDVDELTMLNHDIRAELEDLMKEAGIFEGQPISAYKRSLIELDNKILQKRKEYYLDPINQEKVNQVSPIKEYSAMVDKSLSETEYTSVNSFDTMLKQYRLIFSGKEMINRFALGSKMYNIMFQIAQQDPSLYHSFGFSPTGKTNDGTSYTSTEYSTGLTFGVDNPEHLLFGSFNLNEHSFPFIDGVLKSGLKFKDALEFSQNSVVREFFSAIDHKSSVKHKSPDVLGAATYYLDKLVKLKEDIDLLKVETDPDKIKALQNKIRTGANIPVLWNTDTKGLSQSAAAEPLVKMTHIDDQGDTQVIYVTQDVSPMDNLADIDNIVKIFTQFRNYILKGESAGDNRVFLTLDGQGIASKDKPRWNSIHTFGHGIEFQASAPIEVVVQGRKALEAFRQQYPDWWKDKRQMLDRRKEDGTSKFEDYQALETEKKSLINPVSFIYGMPNLIAEIGALDMVNSAIEDASIMHSKITQDIERKVQLSQGLDEWMGEKQYLSFVKQIEPAMLALHFNNKYGNEQFTSPLLGHTNGSYNIATPYGRKSFWNDFISWIKYLKADQQFGQTDIAKTVLWNKMLLNQNGPRGFLEIFQLDRMTDQEKEVLQGEYAKFYNYPVPNNTDYSLADYINIYQQIVTGLDIGRKSLIDITYHDIFNDYSETLRNLGIKEKFQNPDKYANEKMDLVDETGKPVEKTMKEYMEEIFSVDALNKKKNLLQYASAKKMELWKAKENEILKPQYALRKTQEGQHSVERMFNVDNNGDMLSKIDNMTGFDPTKSTLVNDKDSDIPTIALTPEQSDAINSGQQVTIRKKLQVGYKKGNAVTTTGDAIQITSVRDNEFDIEKSMPIKFTNLMELQSTPYEDYVVGDSKEYDITGAYRYPEVMAGNSRSDDMIHHIASRSNNPGTKAIAQAYVDISNNYPGLFTANIELKPDGFVVGKDILGKDIAFGNGLVGIMTGEGISKGNTKKNIYISDAIFSKIGAYDFEQVVLHEITHELLLDLYEPAFAALFEGDKSRSSFVNETKKAIDKLMTSTIHNITKLWSDPYFKQSVAQYMKDDFQMRELGTPSVPFTPGGFIDKIYGLRANNVKEFTSEVMGNAAFQRLLMDMPGDANADWAKRVLIGNRFMSQYDNFVEKVAHLVSRLAGGKVSRYKENMLNAVMKEIMTYSGWKAGILNSEYQAYSPAGNQPTIIRFSSAKDTGVFSDDLQAARRVLLNTSTVSGAEMTEAANKGKIYTAIIRKTKEDGASSYNMPDGEEIHIPKGSNIHSYVNSISAKYNEISNYTADEIVKWLNSGAEDADATFRYTKDGRVRYSEDTINKLRQHINVSKGDVVVRYSDLPGHITPKGIKDISSGFNPLFKGNDPIVVIHTQADRSLPAGYPIEISIFDISSKSIQKTNKPPFLDSSMPEFLSNDRGIKNFMLTVQAMNLVKNIPNIRIRRLGLLQPLRHDLKASYDVVLDQDDLLQRMNAFTASEKGKIILSKLPDSVSALLSDKSVYKKSFGQEYAWTIHAQYANATSDKNNTRIEAKKKNEFADKMMDVISGKGNKEELIKLLRFRQDAIAQKEGKATIENKEFTMLAAAIRSMEDDAIGSVTEGEPAMNDMNKVSRLIEIPQNTGNQVLDHVRSTIDRNSRWVVDKIKDVQKEIAPAIKSLEQLELLRNPSFAVSPLISDVSGNIYKKMLISEKIKDDKGVEHDMYTGQIHFDENNSATKAALELGKRDKINGLTQEELKAGKQFVEIIHKQMLDLVMHQLAKSGRYGDVMEDDYKDNKSLYDAAVAQLPAFWTDGMIPLMRKSSGKLLFGGNFRKGWKRALDTFKDMSAITSETQESNKGPLGKDFSAGWLSSQMGPIAGIGNATNRGEILGMRYDEVANEWTVIDKDKAEELSTDLEMILNYMTLTVNKKLRFDNRVIPVLNDAKALLHNYKNSGGEDMANSLKWLEWMTNRVVHGQSELLNVGPLDAMGAMAIKANSMFALAFNIPVWLSSGLQNTFSSVGGAIANSTGNTHLAGQKELAKAFTVLATPGQHQLAEQLADIFGIANSSEHDMLHSGYRRKAMRKYVFQSKISNWGNYKTDVETRILWMVAQMIKDGKWDAYSLDKEQNVVYDIKKDREIYNPDGSYTENGKMIEEHIRNHNIKDGWQDKNKPELERGYEYRTMSRLKEVGNLAVFGIDPIESPNTNSFLLWRFFTQFRLFAFNKSGQLWSKPYKRNATGSWSIITDENGQKKRIWVGEDFEGKLNTVIFLAQNVQELLKQPKEFWTNMTPRQKANVGRVTADLFMWSLMIMAYSAAAQALNPEKKYRYFGKAVGGNRFMKSWQYATMDIMNDLSPSFYLQMLKSPFAAATTVDKFWGIAAASFGGDWKHAANLSPGVLPFKSTIQGLEDTYEDIFEEPVQK